MRTFASGVLLCGALVFAAAQEPAGVTFGTTVVVSGGLRGKIYFLASGTQRLPDFDRMQPVGEIYTSELNIPLREWTLGFPGITTRFDWFAIDYHGRFWINAPGAYKFALDSDDGSRLYIDDNLVIDNDGVHMDTKKSGRANLQAGQHEMRVEYFQGPANMLGLVLEVRPPNGKWKVFNTSDFEPPSNPDDWAAQDAERPKLKNIAALEALARKPPRRDFDFLLSSLQFADVALASQKAVVVQVPRENVEPRTRSKGALRFYMLIRIKDEAGKVVRQYEDNLPDIAGQPFSGSFVSLLPQGQYTVEAALVERERDLVSTGVLPLPVQPRTGVGLSSVILARGIERAEASRNDPFVHENVRLLPALNRRLTTHRKHAVYFFAYPDPADARRADARVDVLLNGKPVASQALTLPEPDDRGAIPMHLELPELIGAWELRVTARQGNQFVTQQISCEVAAN